MNSIKDFLDGRIGVRCDTKDEYDRLMRECEGAGLRWRAGMQPTEATWYGNPQTVYANDGVLSWNGAHGEPFSTLFPAPAPEPVKPEPAPYDGRGKHKVGDLFEVTGKIENHGYKRGDIIRYVRPTVSNSPLHDFERVSDGYKQCLMSDQFKPHTPAQKIVITTDGRVTTATLYEDGKPVRTGTAACSAEDEFEFEKGAKLAVDRLLDNKPRTELRVNVSIDTSHVKAALKALRAELDALPGRIHAEVAK